MQHKIVVEAENKYWKLKRELETAIAAQDWAKCAKIQPLVTLAEREWSLAYEKYAIPPMPHIEEKLTTLAVWSKSGEYVASITIVDYIGQEQFTFEFIDDATHKIYNGTMRQIRNAIRNDGYYADVVFTTVEITQDTDNVLD